VKVLFVAVAREKTNAEKHRSRRVEMNALFFRTSWTGYSVAQRHVQERNSHAHRRINVKTRTPQTSFQSANRLSVTYGLNVSSACV